LLRISLSLGGLAPSFTVKEGELLAIASSSSRILLTCQGLGAIENGASSACTAAEADSIIVEVSFRADFGKICVLKTPIQQDSSGECKTQLVQNMSLTQARCFISSGPTGERCASSSTQPEVLVYSGGRNMHGLDIFSVDIKLRHFSSSLPGINETGSMNDISSSASILVPINVQPVASQFEISALPAAVLKNANPTEGEVFPLPNFSLFDPDGNVSFVFGEPAITTPHRLLRVELTCVTESLDVECILTVPRFIKRKIKETDDDFAAIRMADVTVNKEHQLRDIVLNDTVFAVEVKSHSDTMKAPQVACLEMFKTIHIKSEVLKVENIVPQSCD
jgi:hypothetical protein